jgi:hypothetical protein
LQKTTLTFAIMSVQKKVMKIATFIVIAGTIMVLASSCAQRIGCPGAITSAETQQPNS